MDEVAIRILPDDLMVQVPKGTPLVLALQGAGKVLTAPCAGQGVCGRCQVLIVEGTPEPKPSEVALLGPTALAKGWRLGCLVQVEAPLEILYREQDGASKLVGSGFTGPLPLKPAVKSYELELPRPSFADGLADWERLARTLEPALGARPTADLRLMRELPEYLRQTDFRPTVVLRGGRVIGLGATGGLYGVALDLGTTSLAGGLFELQTGRQLSLAAKVNPLVGYGTDLITRITRAEAEDRHAEMTALLRKGVRSLINELIDMAGATHVAIKEILLGGNAVMQHTFLGLPTDKLVRAPFTGALAGSWEGPAGEIDLRPDSAWVQVFPAIAGFIGGDTVAAILATGMHRRRGISLLLDLGTNAEMVLGNRDAMWSCSAAAGPAFEGVNITHGLPAVAGAIQSLSLGPEERHHIIGGGRPRGLCGSGLVDLLAELGRLGLLDARGRFRSAGDGSLRLRSGPHGQEFLLVPGAEAAQGEDITLTQADVHQLQMAKGAIAAGYEILKTEAGLADEAIEEIFLAGSFGNLLNPERAVAIGLIPPHGAAKIRFVGNAAYEGLRQALLNADRRAQAERIPAKVIHVELSGHPLFMDKFIDGMFFPWT